MVSWALPTKIKKKLKPGQCMNNSSTVEILTIPGQCRVKMAMGQIKLLDNFFKFLL